MSRNITRLRIRRPDDWHVHLRDGEMLRSVLPDTVRRFGRAIVMPNLDPPLVTTRQVLAYRRRIQAALPPGSVFEPLMTLYLAEETTPEEITRARNSGFIYGVKLYPSGATTHSHAGVRDIARCYPVFAAMEKLDFPLLIHGEVVDPQVDIFDREKAFIDRHLEGIVKRFPGLRIVFEHITTKQAVEFVQSAPLRVAATLTAHHLLLNRNALFAGGLNPHYYCLPVLKREEHRQALIGAATSGNPRFFLGTDSAPHSRSAKESSCGCAGIYTAHAAIELYAEVFEQASALDKLEAFASHYGAKFYDLPPHSDHITLTKNEWEVPLTLRFAAEKLVPFRAGEKITWKLA